ncbi:PIN domain-containing protein [Aquifex aeolicus]|uniref:PIN domain-containing protein n=1 Tax=Aquifex aeolicus TaxID=63363 RepID=UPI0013E8DBB8|nr:PIN domain-containing protein [Aquifex aeolicus]
MKKIVVDTSVFIRLFTRNDEKKFEKAEKLIDDASKGKIQLFVPFIVVAEIVWVLEKVYKVNRENIRDVVEALINTRPRSNYSIGKLYSFFYV